MCAATLACAVGWTLSLTVATAQTAAPAVPVPEAPDLTYAAWDAIRSRCATCHLSPTGRRPAPPLKALRAPRTLAADRSLVVPGRPDRSALVWRMLDSHDAPRSASGPQPPKPNQPDKAEQAPGAPRLTEGVWLVRRWITRLPQQSAPAPTGTADVLPAGAAQAGEGRLRVDVVQPVFEAGEHIVYRVRTDRHCRLSLINVDPRGIATVVFPNAYARTDQIGGTAAREVPAAEDPFVFTARHRGVEKLIALCAEGEGAALGIRHDFNHQRFTVLGDWERFLATGKPPRPMVRPKARTRWRYRRVRICYRTKRRGRRVRRCRWRRRRAGRIRPKPIEPLPFARLKAVSVVAVRVR